MKQNISFSEEEISDLYRGLVIAMKTLDATDNNADINLSNRLEEITNKIDKSQLTEESTQREVLNKLSEAWNIFVNIPTDQKHPSDPKEFEHHIHCLQNMLYAQAYIKEHGEL